MWPISVVNGPIRNDIRLPECFIGCYRRLVSIVRREGKEREKKNNEEKRERRGNACEIFFEKVIRSILFPRSHPYPTHSFLFFLFLFFCSLLFELSPQSERLQQAKCFSVLLSLFFKTLFSYLNCN